MDSDDRAFRFINARNAIDEFDVLGEEAVLLKVRSELKSLVEEGDMEACEVLGTYLSVLRGDHVEEAVRLLSLAADSGRGAAAHNLGTLYFPLDKSLSRKAYERAYELGTEQQICSDPLWWKRINSDDSRAPSQSPPISDAPPASAPQPAPWADTTESQVYSSLHRSSPFPERCSRKHQA